MSDVNIDFVKGCTQHGADKKEYDLSLCYAYPILNTESNTNVITTENKNVRRLYQEASLVEDGLYVLECPYVYGDLQFSQHNNIKLLEYETKHKLSGKLLGIVIREVNINTDQSDAIEVKSVHLLFKNKIICKANKPFNRKLHKLLIRNSECNNISVRVHIKNGQSSILPLPLPNRNVENNKVEIDFAISDNSGRIYGGTVTCLITLSHYGERGLESYATHLYKLTNDPNDPQNSLSLLRPPKSIHKKKVKYFLLEDPALTFQSDSESTVHRKCSVELAKPPDMVVTEQSAFSLLDAFFRNIFQPKQPLESSAGTHRHHTVGKTTLNLTVLRGVEIPIREESAVVQPFVEVQWGNETQSTPIAEGPAPVWQQIMHFELPKQSEEQCLQFRLYDQHPIWGKQWLGEARIPLQNHRNYQEFERWIALSPLYSPVLLFGYLQASPGQSRTRIYVLIKMENFSTPKSVESSTVNTLLKGVQRCLAASYKINGLERPIDAARMVMLLPSLPVHCGPITPRQALNIRKVDHYGRAALFAVLLQGFNLRTHILLGSSQASKWSSFVLSISENGIHTLWDPDTGKHYNLDDSHCPLIKVYRMVNQFGIWENLQRSMLPYNLKYDTNLAKVWRSIEVTSVKTDYPVQEVDLNITEEEMKRIKKTGIDIEQALKDKLCDWRREIGLTTVFNRHAMTVLRNFVCKIEPSAEVQLDRRDLKQLYRAYHVHGFILNQREGNISDFAEQLRATRIYDIGGPVEFAVVCYVQPYVGKISSVWLAAVILKSRD